MNTEKQIELKEQFSPAENLRLATDVASLCKDIVEKTAVKIGGKKFPPVESWTTIALAHGFIASSDEPKKVEGGWQARAYLTRMSDGMVLGEAYGFLGEDEPVWENRKEYAKRAMAQTRAISRVCRAAFSHVVTMMRIEGMMTTPAEEMMNDTEPERKPNGKPEPSKEPEPKREEVTFEITLSEFSSIGANQETPDCVFAKSGDHNFWCRDAKLYNSIRAAVDSKQDVEVFAVTGKKPNLFQITAIKFLEEGDKDDLPY